MNREQWLKLILPAAVILLAYGLLVNVPAQQRAARLAERLSETQEDAVDYERDAHNLQHELEDLRRDLVTVTREVRELRQDLVGDEGGERLDQSQVIAQLNQVFREHGLTVMNEGQAGREELARLPATYRTTHQRQSTKQERIPLVWHVVARGAYHQGLASLQALPAGVAPVVVTVSDRKHDGTLKWEVFLWH